MTEFLEALEKIAPYLGDLKFHIGLGLLVGLVAIWGVAPHLGDHRYQIGLVLVVAILAMIFPGVRVLGVILASICLLAAIWLQIRANDATKPEVLAARDQPPVYTVNEVRVGFAETLLGMAERYAAKDIGTAIELFGAAKRQCDIAGRLDLASSIEERISDVRGDGLSMP